MKNRKLLIAMLSACFLASCALGVACKKNDGDSVGSSVEESVNTSQENESADENVVEVVLSEKDLELDQYDKAQLSVIVYGSTDAVAWTSSNADVVTVDNAGNVVAVGVGEASVSATVEGVSASCKVVVKAATAAPVISLSSNDVYLNVNGTFTTSVKALWKGEAVEGITYTWTVVEDQATDVAEVANNGEEATFTALKAGTTVFRVAADVYGIHVSKDVAVTVYGDDLSIVASDTTFIPMAGCYSLNLATANIEGYTNSTPLAFDVYENGVKVEDAEIVWTVNDASIVSLDGEQVVAEKAGQTEFIGTYTANGATATVVVRVDVEKPVITLQEPAKPVLEVENLSTLTLESELLGTIESVQLHGKEVMATHIGQMIVFNKTAMPKLAKELGEQTLYVSTNTVTYKLPITLYTMIINNKAEMDSFVTISYETTPEVGVWDGYFVLGNDVDYNGEFIPMASHNYLYVVLNSAGMDKTLRYNTAATGFRGVFDGMGYNIDGLAIGVNNTGGNTAEAGVFGVMHQNGIVRNVSFTNAVCRENSGYIASSGGGLIENVSISYKQIGIGAEVYCPGGNKDARVMSSFYSTNQGVTKTATVRNCFVDASKAKIVYDVQADKQYQWPALQLAGKASTMENVIVVCPNQTVLDNSGANFTFDNYSSLIANDYAQSEFSLWDTSFWTSINGIPFSKNIANNLDREAEISFDAADVLFVGKETTIGVIGQYTNVVLADEYAGVKYANGVLKATEEAVGTTITLVLTSYLNDQVVEKDIIVKQLANVTIEQAESVLVESTDTTLDISAGSQYNGATATVYVGDMIVGQGAVTDGKVAVDATLFSKAGYGETTVQVMSEKDGAYSLYDLKVFYVTRVLRTMDDFAYISVRGGDRKTNPTITGYYILGNDIDCGGAKISANRANEWNVELVGFRGIFDGNGKTISNAVIGECGLFGQVGKDAVIKDVTFDNITFSGAKWQRTTLFGNLVSKATLQNITVNISSYAVSLDDKGVPYVEQGLFGGRYFLNNVVENVTFNVEGYEVYRLMSRVCTGNTFVNVKIYADGYQTIGDSDDQWTVINELPVGVEFISTKTSDER